MKLSFACRFLPRRVSFGREGRKFYRWTEDSEFQISDLSGRGELELLELCTISSDTETPISTVKLATLLPPPTPLTPASALLQPPRPTTATSSHNTGAAASPSTSHVQQAFLSYSTSSTFVNTLPTPVQRTTSPPHSNNSALNSIGTTSPASPSLSLTTTPPKFDINPLFLPSKASPHSIKGTVRIKVETSIFYCHKEVLGLSSPFFENVLCGGWRETEGLGAGVRKVRSGKGKGKGKGKVKEKEVEIVQVDGEMDEDGMTSGAQKEVEVDKIGAKFCSSTSTLDSSSNPTTPTLHISPPPLSSSQTSTNQSDSDVDDDEDEDDEEDEEVEDEPGIVCRLSLKEERASSFQDLLYHIYPRMECMISWNNVGDLCKMADKFDIPSLRNQALAFLLPSAAGNPLLGMKLAEDNNFPELYKEASRYVLDNYQNWSPAEFSILSNPTLLKLERRRSWYLERLLKLGLVQTSRDFICQQNCPDQTLCARLVDEKWRSAWSSAFRFGTPQPSIIYRSLRSLEPSLSSPALHLPHTACQAHARLFVADLFDRMFALGIVPSRSWGSMTLNGTTSSAGGNGRTFGPDMSDKVAKNGGAKYFLMVEMES